eukprot:TRINITY_DN29202_c0_g2_i1.p1 TRINITY_DN29202_c0_g2~~TRINITY_DN29202_c0_g2_i1.p1  ORF type:complete len:527 (-),score=49.38 TRINITY_DN29202_c0_g2_i1:111-1664(-)
MPRLITYVASTCWVFVLCEAVAISDGESRLAPTGPTNSQDDFLAKLNAKILIVALLVLIPACWLAWWYCPAAYADDSEQMTLLRKLAPIWPTVLCQGVAMGLIQPSESYINLNFFARKYTNLDPASINCESKPSVSYCLAAVNDNVEWAGYISLCAALISLLFGSSLGVISDACGRKPVLAVCSTLSLLPCIAQALFVFRNVSLYLYFGLLPFGFLPAVGVWFAVITDLVTNLECRASAFAVALVCWQTSLIVGLVVGAFGTLQHALLASLILHFVNVLYIVFAFPETISRLKALDFTEVIPLKGLSILLRANQIRSLAFVFFTLHFVSHGVAKVSVSYYQKHLAWSSKWNYLNSIVTEVSGVVWVGLALQYFNKAYGEVGLLKISLFSAFVFYLNLYFSRSPAHVVIVGGIFAGLMSFDFPATAALKGGMVNDDEQGQVQGSLQAVKGAAGSLGPACFNLLFYLTDSGSSATITKTSGVLFIVGALLSAGTFPFVDSLPRGLLSKTNDADPEGRSK